MLWYEFPNIFISISIILYNLLIEELLSSLKLRVNSGIEILFICLRFGNLKCTYYINIECILQYLYNLKQILGHK